MFDSFRQRGRNSSHFIRFHYVDSEVGTQYDEGEDFLYGILHVTIKQTLPIHADEDDMALEIPFVPAA